MGPARSAKCHTAKITWLHCHSQTESHGCTAIAKQNHGHMESQSCIATAKQNHGHMESQGCIATAKQNHKTVLTWPNWSTWKFGQCHWLDERAKWRWETVSAVCVRVLRSRLEKGTVQTTGYWHSKQNKTRKCNHNIYLDTFKTGENNTLPESWKATKLQEQQTWRYILCKYYVVYDWKVMTKSGMSEK